MQGTKGGLVTMVLLAAALSGFGYWQFGTLAVGIGEHGEHEHEAHDYAGGERSVGSGDLAAKVLAKYGGSILEVERENEYGRRVFEVKLLDRDGRKRKLLLDAEGRELDRYRD
jgi:hypothetical protein